MSRAASKSPSASVRAFLQSIMPAPVMVRSLFTSAAVIAAIRCCVCWVGIQGKEKGNLRSLDYSKVPFFQRAKKGLFFVSSRFFSNSSLVGFLALSIFFVNFALRQAVFDGLADYAYDELNGLRGVVVGRNRELYQFGV